MNEPEKKSNGKSMSSRMLSLAALKDIKIEEGIPSKQTTKQSLKSAIMEQLSLTPKGSHRKYPYDVASASYLQYLVSEMNNNNFNGKQEYVAMRISDKECTYVWRNL